jgi:CRISPR-associated protein Cmr6
VGLAYDAWAPVGNDGKVPDDDRAKWLSELVAAAVSPDYSRSFERWKASFSASGDRVFELKLASRLLVGHGNSSAAGVGITVHHTWGVPVIPGSALKGLLAHFVDAVYGPDDPERKPWEQEGDERTRADYQGVIWRGRRIERGPGSVFRKIFGAPDAEMDEAMRGRGFDAGASVGLVTFHDALYVPSSIANNQPFAADVLTVHQKDYYDSSGKSWPNDYDCPNPVAFLTVRPGARFLFTLSGPDDWTDLAEHLLRGALERWGVGGKTSAGYGRLVSPGRAPANARSAVPATPSRTATIPKAGDRLDVELLDQRTKKGGWKARHAPSGLEGAIQNSDRVPAGKKPGDTISVVVRSAKGRESGFAVEDAPAKGDASRKGGK